MKPPTTAQNTAWWWVHKASDDERDRFVAKLQNDEELLELVLDALAAAVLREAV